jgi:hypothetical protein
MLHTTTVEPDTLSLIQSLQSKPYTQDFLLVGGTALALQLGHRTSTDIDLFTTLRFDPVELLTMLRTEYNISIRHQMNHAILIDVAEVKTDFVFQPSKIIGEIISEENIRMASMQDIAAMKISAITARGRKRDFIDLYCLMRHFTLKEIIDFFLKKYPDATAMLAIKSLFYFEDAENDFDPKCFFKYNWESVKKAITQAAKKL